MRVPPTSSPSAPYPPPPPHAGSSLLGTAHIASALLQDPRSTINLFLDAQGIPPRVVEEEIISSWEQQPETLNADVPSTEQQVWFWCCLRVGILC